MLAVVVVEAFATRDSDRLTRAIRLSRRRMIAVRSASSVSRRCSVWAVCWRRLPVIATTVARIAAPSCGSKPWASSCARASAMLPSCSSSRLPICLASWWLSTRGSWSTSALMRASWSARRRTVSIAGITRSTMLLWVDTTCWKLNQAISAMATVSSAAVAKTTSSLPISPGRR